MASRKVALIGTDQGAWVATGDLSEPELIVSIQDDEAEILVYQTNKAQPQEEDLEPAQSVRGKGNYAIPPAAWTRIAVCKGDPRTVLCSIVSRKRA